MLAILQISSHNVVEVKVYCAVQTLVSSFFANVVAYAAAPMSEANAVSLSLILEHGFQTVCTLGRVLITTINDEKIE